MCSEYNWANRSNVNKFEHVRTLKGHNGYVFCLVVLPNGLLASGSDDCTIKLWKVNTDLNMIECVMTLLGHSESIIELVVLPNGLLVSLSRKDIIKIWDLNTFECKQTTTPPNNFTLY